MGVRYRATFNSLSGVAWKIDINDSSYSSTVQTFDTGTGGFSLPYKGITERNDPVLASTLSVPFIVANSTDEAFITEVMTSQEERFTVQVYKSTVLYWSGVLLADEVQREDSSYPYEVELSFTDGLSRLKDIDYNNAGTAYTGRSTLLTIILNCLNKTGLSTLYGTNDTFLETRINWYETHHTYTASQCPLAYTDLSNSIFYQYDEAGKVTTMNCHDVLSMILRMFNARITMSDGHYQVLQAQDFSTQYIYFRTFKKGGTLISSGSSNIRITVTDATRKAGAVYRYFQPLREVSKVYKSKIVNSETNNWLPVQSKYETQVGFIGEVYSASYSTVINFTGTIHEWFGGSIGTGFYTIFKFTIRKVKLSDSSVEYLLGGSNFANPQQCSWTATPANYTLFTPLRSGQVWDGYTPFNFYSGPIAEDCSITFELDVYNHYTANGILYTLGVGQIYSYECQDFIGEVSFEGSDVGDEETTYKAVNTITGGGSVASTAKLEIPETLIGDGKYPYSIGKLRTTANLSTWYDSSSWKIRNGMTTAKLNQLCVDQVLKGQRVPVERLQAAWINNAITALTPLYLYPFVYVPLMVTVNPEFDEVSGEWYNCITT